MQNAITDDESVEEEEDDDEDVDDDEEDDADGDSDSEIDENSFTGSSVRKSFDDYGVFDGVVIGNRKIKNKCFHRVRCSDGDTEEHDEEELLDLLV